MSVFATSAEGKPRPADWAGSRFFSFLGRFVTLATSRRRERRLRLCEMLALGDKRFIAVVEYGPEKFLLAGTPQNISLLKHLDCDCKGTDEEPRVGPNPD